VQLATMRLRNGLWRAETDDSESHYVIHQFPDHQTLKLRDDGKRALVQVRTGEGGSAARFLWLA